MELKVEFRPSITRTEIQTYVSTRQVQIQAFFRFALMGIFKISPRRMRSFGQDLVNTCKLILKSKPTLQKKSSEKFAFQKFRNVTRFSH